MTLTYKTSIPTKENLDRIINGMQGIDELTVTGKFINEIPRHNLITLEMPDYKKTQPMWFLEIGALLGALDT